jgi:hypothetical protein
MSKHLRNLAVGTAIAVGLAAAPTVYAQDYLRTPHDSMMGRGMMGEGGMMGMMGGMMERCKEMMQAMGDGRTDRPNDQWRPSELEQPAQPRG